MAIGVCVGTIAGFYGGVDRRRADALRRCVLCFPSIFLLLALGPDRASASLDPRC
jgi:ABC-type dipeptide/oligopeptide/nickel transport system permease subunit